MNENIIWGLVGIGLGLFLGEPLQEIFKSSGDADMDDTDMLSSLVLDELNEDIEEVIDENSSEE